MIFFIMLRVWSGKSSLAARAKTSRKKRDKFMKKFRKWLVFKTAHLGNVFF